MIPARRIGALVICFGLLLACTPAEQSLEPTTRDWSVMGTDLFITVYRESSDAELASADLDAAFAAVSEIDDLMSLYKPDSELTALNASAGQGATSVSAHTFAVLDAADHYAALTDGAVDVTVEPLVRLWGFFDVADASVPGQDRIDEALAKTGMHRLTLDRVSRTAALEPDVRVDLGGIAKGYGVDQALAVLRERDVPAALVNLGGTVGVLGAHPAGRPWIVGIRHPRENQLIGEIRLQDGAVSTSGDYDRYFEHDGKRYSHIIDPRTGWPVEGVYAVTVVAPNATAADALSTAAYVLGRDDGLALLSMCAGVEGVMVEPNANQETLSVRLTEMTDERVSVLIDEEPMVNAVTYSSNASHDRTSECVALVK